jgi:putative toxin-antitoxin system antitoxin component (TIGR02293 family)
MKTLVTACLRPRQAPSPIEVSRQVQDGLAMGEFDALRDLLGVTDRDLARRIGISVPTVYRRRQAGARLDSNASDRLMRFARLFGLTVQFFEGNEAAARRWLMRPAPDLEHAKPLDVAATEVGARAVEQLLGRLEYGVLP